MTGFGLVPEDLHQAGDAVHRAVADTANLRWSGAGGDYGHAGLQQAFGSFVEGLAGQVRALTATATTHGDGLHQAAAAYAGTDADGAGALGSAGSADGRG